MLHHRGAARKSCRADQSAGEGWAVADFPQSADGWIRRLHRGNRTRGVRARLKGIVDPREHCDAFAAIADIDEADYERLRDAAKADSSDGMQFGKRIEIDIVRDPADIEERRDLQNSMGPENIAIPDPRSHLSVRDRGTIIHVAAGAIAAQGLLIGEKALLPAETRHRPEWSLVAGGVVLDEDMTGERDFIVERVVAAQLAAKSGIRHRAQEGAVGDAEI